MSEYKLLTLVVYIHFIMYQEKTKKLAIDFLIYVLHTGLHNSDLTYEELFECYERDKEDFAETIKSYGTND